MRPTLSLRCLAVLSWVLWALSAGSACDCAGEVGQGSELTLEPSSVVFPLTPVGDTSTKTIRLLNKKTIPIEVRAVELSKDTHGAFSILSKLSLPLTIPGEGEAKVELQFAPTEAGGATGALLLTSNASNGEGGSFRVALRSIINAPNPKLSCSPVLDFGSVRIKQKKSLKCTLTNRGTAVWTVTRTQLSEGAHREFFVDASYPLIVQPGAKGVEISVSYSPQDPGADRAELSFLTEVKGKPSEDPPPKLSLRGRSAAAKIEVVPSALIFPFTSGGKASTQKLTARSVGEIELDITKLEFEAGSSPRFKLDPSLKLPLSVPVGTHAELPILYEGGTQSREQGVLLVHSSDPQSPVVRVPLYSVSDGCNLDVSPRKLTFPSRKSITVSVTNQGNRSCLIRSILMDPLSSKDYKMVPEKWPVLSLAPNQVLEFFVEYRPSDNVRDKGTITILSDDPDEPKIELSLDAPIKVEACELSPNPFVLNFGRTPIGRAASRLITLINDGLKPCEIRELQVKSVAPPGVSAFLLGKTIALPATLQPSQQLAVQVLFSPGQSLWYEGALEVKSNDPKRPDFKIKILGSAGPLCIRAVPEDLDLGTSKTTCASRPRAIEIYNICTVPLNISAIALLKGSSPEFKLAKLPTLPVKLNRGQNITVLLDHRPTDLTSDAATLRITNDSASLPKLDIPLRGQGTADDQQTDRFTQSASPKADILFVIDDSFSMSKRQALLAQNLSHFLGLAQSQKVDFRLAVTTTTIRAPSPTTRPGGCFVGTPKLLEPTTPNLLTAFQKRVQVGTQGEAKEQGLEAAYRALTPPLLLDPNCNLGFLRQGASLSLIFVTDEADQSPQQPAFYSTFFNSLRGADLSRVVRISAITAPTPPGKCADATSKGILWNMAKQFGGGTESICNANWQTTLQNLARVTFGLQRQFFLSRPAEPTSIQVKVNQKAVAATTYTYDPKTGALSFKTAPQPNDAIEVQYKAQCIP